MSEYDHEPVRGLPGPLPPDETIIWQGAPQVGAYLRGALHLRLVVLYFGAIGLFGLWRGDMVAALGSLALGLVVVGLAALFAWGVARTTVYTLTDRRIVLRIGVALNKCINLPLSELDSADMKPLGGGAGSIVLRLKGVPRLGYLMLWPHARTLRMMHPQPVLRAIGDAEAVAQMLLTAVQAVQAVAPTARGAAPDQAADPRPTGTGAPATMGLAA